VARLNSGRDLVEEFVASGVWPLAHGWVFGEIRPRRMPTLGNKMVRSPAFTVDLRGWDAVAFVREVESEAIKIVGKYMPKTEMIKSWDICRSNDTGDGQGKQLKTQPEEGTSKGKAMVVATQKGK
jgi:hypothetical protein